MAKKRKKNDLQVSLFPFLSILACVLGILTLMITAVVLSQANNETFQEKVAEAGSAEAEARGLKGGAAQSALGLVALGLLRAGLLGRRLRHQLWPCWSVFVTPLQ